MANNAALLFKNNNNIEIATTKSDCSQQGSSSEASWPPTLESKGMFNDRGDSGEDKVDNNDHDFPQHIFVSTQSSNQSKSSQVSIVYILLMLYLFFSLSAPASVMLPWMLRSFFPLII